MADAPNNDKALKVIEAQYQALQAATGHWQFFVALNDYVRAIVDTPALSAHVRFLQEEQARTQRVLAILDTRAMREAMKTAQQMVERVQASLGPVLKNMEPVLHTITELQKVMAGTILSTSRVRLLDEHMFDAARALKSAGHAELVRKYEVHNTPPKNIYGDFVFVPSLEKLHDEEKRVERARETELWGAWENMSLIAQLMSDPDGFEARLKKEAETDPMKRWQLFNLYGVLGELNRIRKDEAIRDDDLVFFRVGAFRNHASRLQAFLTQRLLVGDVGPKFSEPEFNSHESVLTFGGHKVRIASSRNSDPHDLLRVIFADKRRTWSCSDILDEWLIDRDPLKVPRLKAYHAAKAVNRKVAEQTTITDFLKITTKEIRINPKYLPELT